MDERAPASRRGTAVVPALLWATFAQCAAITALLVPAHILVQGILGPLGWLPSPDKRYDTFAAMIGSPLVKIYLLILFATSFYVAAHRVRYLLLDLGLHVAKLPVALALYGLAALGTLIAAYLLFTLP